MAGSLSSLRFAFVGLGGLAVLAGCGGGGSSQGVDRPSGALLIGGTPTVQKLNTPLGLTGSRGSGALVYVSFNLRDKEFNPTNIQLEYGFDVNGDGNITGSAADPAPDDEYFPCTPAPGVGDGSVGLDSATGKGSDHLFVWNSGVDTPTKRFVTQDYQYTPEGRQVLGSDGQPLFGSTPGIRLRMRANDFDGRPDRWGAWRVTTAFDLNNNQQPAVTIEPVGLNGVTPNATGSAADENVVLNIRCIDEDSGLGFADPMAVAVDYAFVPPGTNLANPVQVAALAWTPATTYAGTTDTGLDTSSAPGTPHTYTWDSAADAGTVNGNYVLRVTPFDSKSETGPTVMQTGSFLLDNYTIFTDVGASLAAARVGHRATTLGDNRVLIAGGSTTVGGAAVNSAELFYPGVGQTTLGAVAPTGSMNTGRTFHSQTRLNDDKVLVAGGFNAAGAPLNTLEVYDPVAGTWTTLGLTLGTARARHPAFLLADGDVLFAGGVDGAGNALASGEVYRLDTNQIVAVGNSMSAGRHSVEGALLPTYRALIPGGTGAGGSALASVESYDPATNLFSSATPMATARSQHSVSSGFDGRVFAVGGVGVSSIEVFDPRAGTWTTAPASLTSARSGHVGIMMGSHRILAAGGFNGASVTGTADEFVVASNTVNAPNGSEITARRDAASCILNNGRVLLIGGQNGAGAALSSIEVYSPDAGFNFGPTAFITTPQEEQSWGFGAVFNYRLVDPEQNRAKVVFQYSIAGGPWQACTPQGGPFLDATNDPDTIAGDINEGMVDLVTTAANTSLPIDPILKNTVGDHLFIWDMRPDIAKADYPTVKVRCLPVGASVGVGASTTSFKIAKNTRVIPSFEGFAAPQHGSVDIWYHLRDIDNPASGTNGDFARVEFQYGIDLNNDKQILTDDGESFKTCTEVTDPAGSEGLGAGWTLATSKTFTARAVNTLGWHLFRWDSVRDVGSPDLSPALIQNVILRITPYDNPDFFAPVSDPLAVESKGRVVQLTSTPANGIKLDLDTTNGLFLTRVENENNSKFYQTFPSVSGSIPFAGILLDETMVFTFNHAVDPASVDGAVGLNTLKVMVGARQILGAYRSDVATKKVYFYPLLQEIKDNLPKYTRAVGETQTVLFRNDTCSVVIPGYVAGTDPTTAVVLRKNGWTATKAAVEIVNLLTRNYGSAFVTSNTIGAGAYVLRGAAEAPSFISSTPAQGATGVATTVTTVTVNVKNQISGESATVSALRFRVDMNGDGIVSANDPVLFGKYQVTNTAGQQNSASGSVITFILDSAYTLPPDSQILIEFSGVTSGNGPTAGATAKTTFTTVTGPTTNTSFVEAFNSGSSQQDTTLTTALWGDTAFPGILTGNRDGGTGVDGVATGNGSLSGGIRTFSASKPSNTWNFTAFTIPKGETWVFTNGPVTLNCTTNFDIAGVLDVSGGDGLGRNTEPISAYTTTQSPYGARYATTFATGGVISAGGTAKTGGGAGGGGLALTSGQAGTPGTGAAAANAGGGGSQYSGIYQTGGGGAGHAQAGQAGSLYQAGYGSAGAGGTAYGTTTFSSGMTAGSGGGSGSSYNTSYVNVYDQVAHGSSSYGYYNFYWPGGSGGGGGGAVKFNCNGSFTIRGSGIIDASGGCGGNGYYYYAGGGGGGSGGSVWIRCGGTLIQGGIIDVRGGFGGEVYNYHPYASGTPTRYGPTGGHGSAGRVRLEAPNFNPSSLPVTTQFIAGTTFNTVASASLNGGSGGAAFPGSSTATVNIDSIAKDANGFMNFGSMNIPAGVTVTLTGSTPAKIRVTGAVTISGVLRAPGGNGVAGVYSSTGTAGVIAGGIAGPGGYVGGIPNGSGVTSHVRGGNGGGPSNSGGGGGYPANLWNGSYYYGSSSGGGGANMIQFSNAAVGTTAGGIPNNPNNTGREGTVHDYYNSGYGSVRTKGPAGVGFQDPETLTMSNLVGGGGGGAGSNSGYSSYFYGASSGGGGGGAIGIETTSAFTMGAAARVELTGGTGGNYAYNYNSGAGGGGAGGTFIVRAASLAISSGARIDTMGGVGGHSYSGITSYLMNTGGVGGIGIARFETAAATVPNFVNEGGILGYSSTTGSLTTAFLKGGGPLGYTKWLPIVAGHTTADFNTQSVDISSSPSGDVNINLEAAPISPITGIQDTNVALYQTRKIFGTASTPLTTGFAAPDNVDGFKYFRFVVTMNPPSASFPGLPELTNLSMQITSK